MRPIQLTALFEDDFEEKEVKISDQAKKKFLEMVRGFSEYGGQVYREGNLVEIAKKLHKVCELASHFTVNEAGDWFDKITVQRNMKELTGLSKDFGKIAIEAQQLQDRMSALYEDMGHILNRYYEISGTEEETIED